LYTLSCFDDAVFDLVGAASTTIAVIDPTSMEGLATVGACETVMLLGIVEKGVVGDSSTSAGETIT
jgi:hypothetical protein